MSTSWPTVANIPTRHRAGNRKGFIAPPQSSSPNRTAGRTRLGGGVAREELVIYELHVGTFTPEGTLEAVAARLPQLASLGVTAIELMPVAQFPGERNWGYDGVYPYAVQNSYGGPRALQRLVDAAHQAGLAVILDVVYNHLGAEGNYVANFGPYFTDHYRTPWGTAVNYDGRQSDAVRDFVVDKPRTWVRDFHVDGLRLDAVHAIYDFGAWHILAEIQAAVQDEAARAADRPCHRGKRSERRPPGPFAGAGRPWAGRRLERRFSSQHSRDVDRRAGRLLPGFWRTGAACQGTERRVRVRRLL